MAFALTIKEPPKPSSREYKTVAERCHACQINGGDEQPCMKAAARDRHFAATGRPCYFAPLDPANAIPATILQFVFSEELRSLAPEMFRALTEDLPAPTRAELLEAVQIAIGDPQVVALRHPNHGETPRR